MTEGTDPLAPRPSRQDPRAVDGVLVLDKPEGLTSFEAVAKTRSRLRVKRAGHTGTLDPMATGVLPICLGEATKLVPFLTDADKEYEAEVCLGTATDTQDRTGKVVAERPVGELGRERLEEVLAGFLGERSQVPPMYSAVRVAGRRLYELAREGQEVEREARPVVFHAIELLSLAPPRFCLRVRCSKGTFIRTLAQDLGEALGTCAHLSALRRTKSAGFTLADSLQLEAVAPGVALLSPREALRFLPELVLDAAQEARVRQGQRLAREAFEALRPLSEGARLRLTGADGELIAVAELKGTAVQAVRVLVKAPRS